MKTVVAITFATFLSSCAMSAAGLAETDVEMMIPSERSSQDFAICVAESLIGDVELRNSGSHYWVLRQNAYGVPVSRWDFRPRPDGGSNAELRATISINTGDERVRNCAQ